MLKKYFLENGIHYSTTVGDSMYPMLRDRKDRIVVKPIEHRPKLLDVVLYQRKTGTIILHRVIAIGKENIYTCGDNRYNIEKLPNELVLGKLTGFYRGNNFYSTSTLLFWLYSIVWWIIFPMRFIFMFIKRKIIRNLLKIGMKNDKQ